jgi:hypothetical protein
MPNIRLRTWLKREPPAASVRVHVGEDDEERIIKIDPTDPRRWARTEETIAALDASCVEALDLEGNVLRAQPLGEEEAADPGASSAIALDPADEPPLVQLARLLNEASENSAQRHETAYKTAFDLLAEIVRLCINNMVAVSKTNERLNRRLEQIEAAPGEGASDPQALPEMFVQGVMARMLNPAGGPPAAAPGAPRPAGDNGAAPTLDGMAGLLSMLSSLKPTHAPGPVVEAPAAAPPAPAPPANPKPGRK